MRRLGIEAWLLGAFVLAGPAVADEGSTGAWSGGEEEIAAAPDAESVSPSNLGYSDFQPQSVGSEDCHYDTPGDGNGGFVAAEGPGGVCCLVAGVHLPDGVTVTSIFFYLFDVSLEDVTLSLRRKRIDDESSSTAMGTVTTSGSQDAIRIFPDLTISQGLIDNRNYTYYVSSDTCFDQELDLRLQAGLIFFSEGS